MELKELDLSILSMECIVIMPEGSPTYFVHETSMRLLADATSEKAHMMLSQVAEI